MAKTPPAEKPLINLLPFQQEVFWQTYRLLFMVWRRQAGKSHLFGSKAMSRCIKLRDHLVCYVSGSLLMGQEIVIKEAKLWAVLIDAYRKVARMSGGQLRTSADVGGMAIPTDGDKEGSLLDFDALCDLFENSKLECRIWHDNTSYSRTRVLSPNPDTARGFSGDILGDEIGFWPDFKATWDAIEPIISRNPAWLMWLATTPPADDTHPTYELLMPDQESFEVNPRGNWYKTQSNNGTGFPVHRVDAYDAEAAGLPLFSLQDGVPTSVGEARLQAVDRESFDRNYLLKFIAGGAAALNLTDILKAQMRGSQLGIANRVFETISQAA
jgi:hypothetical protein